MHRHVGVYMERKDVRSIVLSMVLGDGCLGVYTDNYGKKYGRLTMHHGHAQRDYLEWKASLLSLCFNKKVSVREHKKGPQAAISVRRFKAWKKFCYPNNRKNINKIFPFIRHPELALAIWLMDDGYVEPSIDKERNKLYSVSLRLFTCSVPVVEQEEIILWFEKTFGVTPKIKFQKRGRKNYVPQGDDFPFLKFTTNDSLKLWGTIRSKVLELPSMRHKFRYIEAIYQVRVIQRAGNNVNLDTIV